MGEFRRITEEESLYGALEKKTVAEIVADINREDAKVAAAVAAALPQVEELLRRLVPRVKAGGRVFYVGAGTSGRLGVLDASEIPPTFGMPAGVVIGVIAGGERALRQAVEKAEDDTEAGWRDLLAHQAGGMDSVIGIAASGTTPYALGAVRAARAAGLLTGAITCNPDSPLSREAEIAIEVVVGPEYVTGSSRMKAGTAQKMVLNMLSTALMLQLGRVQGNRMVHMQLTNAKLTDRGARMVADALGVGYEEAERLLLAHGSVDAAIRNGQRGCGV